jgi:uncharacterized protein YcbK (DUF882 family)
MHSADFELVHAIQEAADDLSLRYHVDTRVIISSGNRCPYWNEHEGGSKDSKHMYGIAADFYVVGVPALALYEYLDKKYPKRCGIGLYKGRVHLDMRAIKARWDRS